MLGKNDEVAHVAFDPVMVAFACKEPAQTILRDIRLNGQGIASLPSSRERCGVQVRAKQLKLWPLVAARRFFQQKDRYRVDLFARRTARNPHSNAVVLTALLEQLGDDATSELLERRGITKETCHRNQQIAQERLRLLGVVA